MVRTHFGSARLKPRPYKDDRGPNEGNYNQSSKNRRDNPSYSVKPPFNWRETRGRGRGRPPLTRRGPPVVEHRESRFNHWRSQHQDSAHHPKMEPCHGQRRQSPFRSNRSPQMHHHSSPHSPARGQPSHGGPSFHGHPSNRRSPERHFRDHPADRRPGFAPMSRGSFRGRKRQSGFPHQDQHNRDPRSRERPYEHSGDGGKRWKEPGSFLHPSNGEHRFSGSQRSPREMHGRISERWSSEQDSRRQRGPVERQGSRPHSRERADVPHMAPYRGPSWKGGPSPESSYRSPQSQTTGLHKKRIPSAYTAGASQEHNIPKFTRRERPSLITHRPFGGRPLTLRAKSYMVKNRQIQAQSLMRLKLPPMIKNVRRFHSMAEQENANSILATRKMRFQHNAVPLRNVESRRPKQQSPQKEDGSTDKSSRDSGSGKEQVESRRSLTTNRSSPIEKRDLVVLSHWPPGPSSSSKDFSAPKGSNLQLSSDLSSDEDTSKKRLSKDSDSKSPENKKPSHPERRLSRPQDVMQDSNRTSRPLSRPASFQRPNFYGGPRRMGPEPFGNKRPLMETLVTRSFSNQKPVFRKSASIMHKYRNMRVLRQRPPYNRGPNQSRW